MKDLSTSKLRFLADEDVDARLVKSLISRGIDIEFAPKGIRNSKLYSLACEQQKVLLSFDKDFLNTALFPPSALPAIAVVRIHLPTLSMLESFILEFISTFSDDMKGKTWLLREEGAVLAD